MTELCTTLGGYTVTVKLRADQSTQVGIFAGPRHVYLYPPSVADLDTLAAELPALLTAIAAGLRAEGLDDLRSTWDQQFYGPRVGAETGGAA
jgi:hypothetical protein